MSYSDSELIMSKRQRELKSLVIVLRGVPGSGKTTTALRLFEMFKDIYNYRVHIFCRDTYRQDYCKRHNCDYQNSFRNPQVNTRVRDIFYEDIFVHLEYMRNVPSVTIIDSTNTKLADIKHLFWIIKTSLSYEIERHRIYVYNKHTEYNSVQQVPESIMEIFRSEMNEFTEWLNHHTTDINYKMVNKICIK